ncbi:MAG: PASTA domain-containing protein [Pyrinomonadaceae bacterium]|nr:PASTA domain-containing protein [Pyrinomonadaceae bacterium]
MGLQNKAISGVLRLVGLASIVAVFFLSMAGVVYMSLQGSEVKVPELVGKNVTETEKELASLGLKVKKRAERVSAEPIDSVIEQLPKPGETVKTGQVIYVVTSKGGGTPADVPATVNSDEDDSKKIEEMITDKPKKTATKKKADTTRDLTNSNSASDADKGDSSEKTDTDSKATDKKTTSDDKPASNKQTPAKKDSDDPKNKKDKDNKPKPAAKKDR